MLRSFLTQYEIIYMNTKKEIIILWVAVVHKKIIISFTILLFQLKSWLMVILCSRRENYITLQYTTLRYITLRYITLHVIHPL